SLSLSPKVVPLSVSNRKPRVSGPPSPFIADPFEDHTVDRFFGSIMATRFT
ncbi:hypothetical protein JMJ77_0007444, partial [Colletotrichum scovillei]